MQEANPGPLASYASNVTSQFGENGILGEILRRLDLHGGTCVEFGAWDGTLNSNTWPLWAEHGWSAVLIEGDDEKCETLRASVAGNDRVQAITAMVEPSGPSSLDALLARSGVPPRFELLSIDVDGDDHLIWEASSCEPAIVVIEYNASFPPDVEFVQARGAFTGSSARSIELLGLRKGYVLVAMTWANLVFVRGDLAGSLELPAVTVAELFVPWALPLVYSDFVGHHYVLRPSPWGYLGASRHGDVRVRAAARELATFARDRATRRWPQIGRMTRPLRHRLRPPAS